MNLILRSAFIVALLMTVFGAAPAFALADGYFDASWTGGGRFVFAGDYYNPNSSSSVDMAVTQGDGTLFLAGNVNIDLGDQYWWLGQLSSAGQFVSQFGSALGGGLGSITSCEFGFNCNLNDTLYSVLPQTDGKYLALSQEYVLRTTAQAHALDTAGVSGGNGYVANIGGYFINTDMGSINPAYAMLLQKNGKLLLAGPGHTQLSDHTPGLGVLRLNSDLSLDTNFNSITAGFAGGATVRVDPSDAGEIATAVLVQTDGRIVVVGRALYVDYLDLARFNADGSLDTSFGVGGTGTVELISPDGQIESLSAKLDAADRIVVAVRTTGDPGVLVARVTAAGKADSDFGTAGFFSDTAAPLSCSTVAGLDLAIDSAGRILVAGFCDTSFLVERIRGDHGTLDTSFGITGRSHGHFQALATDVAHALTLDAGGRPIVGGSSAVGGIQASGIARLTYDLIYTNNFEIAPRGCLPPDCN